MKALESAPLSVSLAFASDRVVPVGRLAIVDRRVAFEYASSFVATGLTINPGLRRPGVEIEWPRNPRAFAGLHGVLSDSLPDAWGELLVRRRAIAAGIEYASLTVLDRLAAVGRFGMGALVYEPHVPEAAEVGKASEAIDLDPLARASRAILAGDDSTLVELLAKLGGSSGGARPKVFVALEDGRFIAPGGDSHEQWIVKFRSPGDRADIGPLEAAYADMGRAAGLEISQTRLVEAKRGAGFFATKRFDRFPKGERVHVLSVAAFLDADWTVPSSDYRDLLSVTRDVTRHEADVRAMYRRMVFNVVACNRDDHLKQHAFVMTRGGTWRLAPAYDLTYSSGPANEHYLTIDGHGKDVPMAAFESVAKSHGIKLAVARTIVDDVRAAVADFEVHASRYGVSRKTRIEVGRVLDRSVAAYSRLAR